MLRFRHISLTAALLLTALLLVGCSDDSIPIADTSGENNVSELGYDLQLYIQKEMKSSVRSPRPMYSSEQDNNINEVWLRLFVRVDGEWKPAEDHAHIWAMVADINDGKNVQSYTTAAGNTFHYIDLTQERNNRLRWNDADVNIYFQDGFRIKLVGLQPNCEYLVTGTGYNTPMNFEFLYEEKDPAIEAQWYPNKILGGGNGGAEHDTETGEVIYEPEIDDKTGVVINQVVARQEEELFHGATVFYTNADGDITHYKCTNDTEAISIMNSSGRPVTACQLRLYRQVAGVLGYFKNIPTRVDVVNDKTGETEKIEVVAVRVVCAARCSRIRMTDVNGDLKNWVDEPQFQYGHPETCFTIPIPDDAKKSDIDADGNEVDYNIWHIPARQIGVNGYEYSTVRNSIIGSGFWLPVPACQFVTATGLEYPATTFQIQLLGAPERVLRTFNVRLEDGGYSFPVLRDYFYSLGLKVGRGLGSDRPEEDIYYKPEDSEDNPLDLSKSDDIMIIVADAWEESHFFVIGSQQSAY